VVPTEPSRSPEPRLLDTLGVSAEDEQVYRALLARPGATVAVLSRQTGRSAASLRRALPRLEELGLVSRLAGQPPRLVPTRPDVAVEALVSRRQEELAQARVAAQALLAELPTSEHHQPEELVEIVLGKQAVAQRFLQLQQGAVEEIMVLDRPPYAQDPQEHNPAEPEALRKGVRVRGIYAAEALEIPGALALVQEAIAAGEEARIGTDVPTKLAIADRKLAILPLTPSQPEIVHSALIVHASTLLDALVGLFEMLWRVAVPLPALDGLGSVGEAGLDLAPSTPDGANPDPQLVTLLTAGLKDEAIARQLGVSLRTVHRRTSRIMQELGARTRFQAGLHVARRGWVTPEAAP
jgi:sugar-specific transcriptional regulator TrmB